MNQALHTYADLLISPYKFESVTELKITKQLNEHAKLYIRGMIAEERIDHDVESADEDERIDVSVRDGNRKLRLFQGVVTSIAVESVRNVRTVVIEALSTTCLMDIRKESRSYQNKAMKYSEIFTTATKEYRDAEVIDQASGGKSIGDFLVQYKETDWEFIKRLASHFHAALAPVCSVEGVKFYVGLPNNPARRRLNEFNYSIKNNLKEYRLKSAGEGLDIQAQDFIRYEATTNEVFELCDAVEFNNRKLYVYNAVTEFRNGVLVHTYQFMDAKGFSFGKTYNRALAGTSLFGKVIGIHNDTVKVFLDIDKNQDDATASWFPYSTIYSSPDGSGWYCMPESGDQIRVYFPDEHDGHAFAASSVNLASSDSKKRSDPSVKSISTKYGKQIVFQPGAVEIIGSGQLLMRLTDDGGIEINSDKKITVTAEDDIEINGAKVIIQGEEGVDLKQANAALTILDEVTLSGGKVNIV
ncbi:contractile injection system protein, VgrG/Pvc8 family [Paenibacillus sp. NPDC058071]|uniref:contractile injection system protein, VgrG/Pvc8 family n=1 Tax=Paenibacillus sp. NPDC058071 TaxID=3346326 RepID=UPI0036DB97EB